MKVFLMMLLWGKLVAYIDLRAHVSLPGMQRSAHYCHLLQGTLTVPDLFGLVSFSFGCWYRCSHPHLGRLFQSLRILKLTFQNSSMFSQQVPKQENH